MANKTSYIEFRICNLYLKYDVVWDVISYIHTFYIGYKIFFRNVTQIPKITYLTYFIKYLIWATIWKKVTSDKILTF